MSSSVSAHLYHVRMTKLGHVAPHVFDEDLLFEPPGIHTSPAVSAVEESSRAVTALLKAAIKHDKVVIMHLVMEQAYGDTTAIASVRRSRVTILTSLSCFLLLSCQVVAAVTALPCLSPALHTNFALFVHTFNIASMLYTCPVLDSSFLCYMMHFYPFLALHCDIM